MFSPWCEPPPFSMGAPSQASPFTEPSTPPKGARCVGCGSDNTIRIHYGAPSCHGCKAFFRRSVFEGRNYECSSTNNCDVTPVYRNRCRACRYRNCLNGGMNSKLVREERFKSAMKNGCARPQSVPMTTFINLSPKSETEFVIKSEPCDEEMHIIELAMQLERNVEHKKDKPPGEVDEVQLWSQHLFNNMGINNGQNMIIQRSPMNWRCETILTTTDMYYAWYRAYVLLADWAHSIPEFKQLSLSDQENFSAFGWMTYAYRSYEQGFGDIGLPMGNGSYIPYQQHEQAMMDATWANTYGLVCKSVIELVVHPMREIGITFEEFCILKTIALFQQDSRLCLQSTKLCTSYREKLLRALAVTIDLKFPHFTSTQKSIRATKMSLILPTFYNIGRIEADMIRNLSMYDLNRASGVPFVILNNYRPTQF